MKNIAVFILGTGTNFLDVIDWEKQAKLFGKIALIVSDRPDAYGIIRAQEAGIKSVVIDQNNYSTPKDHENAIERHLNENNIDLILLVGYMRLFTADFVKKWYLKIINLHPAFSPSSSGKKVGEKTFDSGIIILQDIVKILPNDIIELLTKRIQNLEHELLPQTVNLVASAEEYIVEARRVILKNQSIAVNR